MIESLDFLQSVKNLNTAFSVYSNEKNWQQMDAPCWVFFCNYDTVSKTFINSILGQR